MLLAMRLNSLSNDFKEEKQNDVLPWHSRSLDLNPMEKCWDEVAEFVLTRNFSSANELEVAIIRE